MFIHKAHCSCPYCIFKQKITQARAQARVSVCVSVCEANVGRGLHLTIYITSKVDVCAKET